MSMRQSDSLLLNSNRGYEYLLKLIIVGDPDVGKEEILQEFESDSERELLARTSASLPRPTSNNVTRGHTLATTLGSTIASVVPGGVLDSGLSLNEPLADSTSSDTIVHESETSNGAQNSAEFNTLSNSIVQPVSTSTAHASIRGRCDDGACRTVTMLLDGKRIKIAMWTASGQGRFAFVLRSLARGAHGIVIVYDITSRYSFKGLERWLKEVDTYAHGTPRVLVGNRLHLAFRRQVSDAEATAFARRYALEHFEISPLAHNFNVLETFAFVCRAALKRTELPATLRARRSNSQQSPQPQLVLPDSPLSPTVLSDVSFETDTNWCVVPSLQELCVKRICASLTVYDIARLPLPERIRQFLKSYAIANPSYIHLRNTLSTLKKRHARRRSPRDVLFGAFNLNLSAAFGTSQASTSRGERSCTKQSQTGADSDTCTCSSVRRAHSTIRDDQRSTSSLRRAKTKTQSECTRNAGVALAPLQCESTTPNRLDENIRITRSLGRAQSLSVGNAASHQSSAGCEQTYATASSAPSTANKSRSHNPSHNSDKCCVS